MRHAFSFVLIGIAACIVGIGSAWIALSGELRFNKIELGQWVIWPQAGEKDADPYTKAYLARKGSVWMSITEGLAFFAMQDENGLPFDSDCTYRLSGKIPRGRLWTLASEPEKDFLASGSDPQSQSSRYITSADTIWSENEELSIAISRAAQPGNWLQVGGSGTFSLVLRIYDTPLTSGALDAAIKTPAIVRETCG